MRKSILLVSILIICFTGVKSSFAQVVINEFMASNSITIMDPDYDDNPDWIELYNTSSAAVSLKGYYLSDNISNPGKWKINSDIQIAAHGFLIIWADGMDAGLHASFKLSASGEEVALASPDMVVIDSVIYGLQEVDISYGRKNDGGADWGFFDKPTPGAKNSTTAYNDIVNSVPNFSVKGGIYSSPQTVELKTLFGGDVRYTLDGSEPHVQSMVAVAPIVVSQTTVIRARIYKPGQLLGPVVTHTYFIDPTNSIGSLPVVSISSDPDNFWGSEKGIYAQDFKPDWEVPVNVELFENDGSDRAAFNVQAGIKINGLYSWQLPQKMLGVYFRKEYGTSKLEYPLIFEKDRKKFDDFAFRASGSDWGSTLFRDGIIQRAAVLNTNLDNSGFRTCVVYINGEFMGIHNIREKIDEDYVVGNHGLKGGTFDMVEETDKGPVPETGDLDAYTELFDLASKDLNVEANWNAVADIVDIEDFTDLVCTEAFDGNSSIGHNLMAWKPKDSGKWKWIIMDLDRGFPGLNSQMIDFYMRESGWPFGKLMKNDDYKKYFGRKLADLLFTTFNPARIVPMIEEHKQNIEALMPKQIARWQGTKGTGNYSNISAISSLNSWNSNVEYLKTYAQGRPAVLLEDLTKYGFEKSELISVVTSPAGAGNLTFNGLEIPVDECEGAYPGNEEITLTADAKPGYQFKGWQGSSTVALITRESDWKYFDKGSEPVANWNNLGFDDSAWSSGQAELGYGDGDENTVVDYGGSSSNKYVTTYFRKSFTINAKDIIETMEFGLKCDDGAVVYINGKEIERQNMPAGDINFGTLASSTVGSGAESVFTVYSADPSVLVNGVNIIAVEIHQGSKSSSDISFDLELSAHSLGGGNYLSTQREYKFTMDGEKNIAAIFESTGQCIVDTEIDGEVTLNAACSPYVVPDDVTIKSNGKLIIEPGVELLIADGASIFANGPIIAKGTENNPIRFRSNPESSQGKWGIISFKNVQDTSYFTNVIIEDASHGPHPVREIAAISLFHSNIKMDHLTIENVYENPISARYSDVTLTNSYLHSSVTGDLINVKYGKGYIANCTFRGNDQPDTDAIDYDDVENGIIHNCIISDMHGFNSDAIDIGEKASNIKIDSVFVYNITDKGVSVGQQSSAHIAYSVFANCNLGAGLKDSCYVTIDHCTYYGTGIAIACFEKNAGDAGGNCYVTNSILSNSYNDSYLVDEYSGIDISYSSSDNERLPDGKHNLFGDPKFDSPNFYSFGLTSGSPCLNSANSGNMGVGFSFSDMQPNLMITDIAYYTDPNVDIPEFIAITNVGNADVDVSGYSITRGFTFQFPEGTEIKAHQRVFITDNQSSSFWNGKGAKLFQWESGKLADEGETIQLETDNGIILDGVKYNNKAPWPEFEDAMKALTLSSNELDNHFGENWVLKSIGDAVSVDNLNIAMDRFYPNPAHGTVYVKGDVLSGRTINVFNLSGEKVTTIILGEGQQSIRLDKLKPGVYLLQCGNINQRIMLK